MERKDFLKSIGATGLGLTLPLSTIFAKSGDTKTLAGCTLIPSETAGPFPLDLTANTNYFRQDVREGKAGVQLNVKMKIFGVDNCQPMPNVRVNIWHCDKDGSYSGYDNAMNPGQAGKTYLRGYQMTDANGNVEFISIFPGWYNGRICHIHFQVYVSSAYSAVSQFSFDIAAKNALYAANSTIYTKGADPTQFSGDNIFSDGYSLQMATLTPNASTGGYDAYIEVAVQGSGTVGVGHIEKENAKQFVLGQNYPNPYTDETTIPLTLMRNSDVTVDIYEVSGKKATTTTMKNMPAGDHNIHLDFKTLGLQSANYVYQVEVRNPEGIFTDCKVLTAQK